MQAAAAIPGTAFEIASDSSLLKLEIDNRREQQRPPEGDEWNTWVLHPGRGWGKGFTAAYWIRDRVNRGQANQIALVGSTQAHVRQLMIENPLSGILKICPDARYIQSRAEVVWPNGAKAYICSAENADVPPLRGGNFDTAWADEVDSWGSDTTNERAQLAWDNLLLSVRLGDARKIVTSTPKPGRIISGLLQEAKGGPEVVVTTGSTYDNAANLSPQFIKVIERKYKGTRLERQEIYGEVMGLVYGALWEPEYFRVKGVDPEQLGRIVVGVDPSGGGDEIGIVAVGLLSNGDYVVLDDWTLTASPARWAKRAFELYEKWAADCIVAEVNYGGDMVKSTLQTAHPDVPVRMVHASRGKHIRAEPISLLYEQKRVWHRTGADLEFLEDEYLHMTTRGYEGKGRASPNRLDAAVWAATELSSRVGDQNVLFGDDDDDTDYDEIAAETERLERELGLI